MDEWMEGPMDEWV